MSRRRTLAKIVLPLAVLLFGLLGLYLLIATDGQPEQVAPLARRPAVEVTIATPQREEVDVQARGIVVEARRMQIRPQVAGSIVWLADDLEPGALLEKGEPLLRLDPADYQLAVVDRKAAVAEARLALREAQSRREVAEHGWRLYGGQGPDPESADSALALHIPQVQAAKEQLEAARSRLRLARLDLERTEIAAPFDSTVVDKQVDLGESVSPQQVLATVVGTDRYWVRATVDVSMLGAIRLPDPETGEDGADVVVSQEFGGERIERRGRVMRLVKTLSEQGNLAQLLVQVDDPLGLDAKDGSPPLLLGAYVNAVIEAEPLEEVVAIPRYALHEDDSVWIVNEAGQLARQEVELVWRRPEEVLIRGVEPGVRIVTSRIARPIPGTEVEVLREAPRSLEASLEKRGP